MSDIGDGMASDKTTVPACSDQYEFKPALKQHVRFLLLCYSYVLLSNLQFSNVIKIVARLIVARPSSRYLSNI
jgi:hypothetical protein